MCKTNERRGREHLANLRRGELKRFFRHQGVPEAEVHNLVEDLLAERPRWSAAELGKWIGLTFEEKLSLRIRTIQCMDRTLDEVKAHFREQKRMRDRVRKQRLGQ